MEKRGRKCKLTAIEFVLHVPAVKEAITGPTEGDTLPIVALELVMQHIFALVLATD